MGAHGFWALMGGSTILCCYISSCKAFYMSESSSTYSLIFQRFDLHMCCHGVPVFFVFEAVVVLAENFRYTSSNWL